MPAFCVLLFVGLQLALHNDFPLKAKAKVHYTSFPVASP